MWISIALALAAAPAAGAALSELAELAAGRSPGREALAAMSRQAEAGAREARLRRLPSMSAGIAAMRGDDPVYAFGSLLRQRSFGMPDLALDRLNRPGYKTNVHSSVELVAPLFTAFELETAERLGRLSGESARRGAAGEEQLARWRAAEAAVSILARKATLDAVRERLRLGEEDVAAARRLKARGLALGSDQAAAEAILAGLAAWEKRLEGELEAQRAALASLTGRPPSEIEPSGILAEPAYAPPPGQALAREALARRADAAAARLAVEASQASVRQAAWSWLPRVQAFASLESDASGLSGPSSKLIGARASVPFGDPAYGARKAAAREAEAASRAEARRTEEAASLQVLQARAAYEAAAASLAPLSDMRHRAAAAAAEFRPLYREGRQSVLEVLRAHEAVARAEAAWLEAAAAAHAGYARLLLAAGGLDAEAVARISRSLEGKP